MQAMNIEKNQYMRDMKCIPEHSMTPCIFFNFFSVIRMFRYKLIYLSYGVETWRV